MPKQVKIAILISVLAFAGFAAYAVYQSKNYQASFVKEVAVEISDRERKRYEGLVAGAQAEIDSPQTADEDKYGAYIKKAGYLIKLGKLSEAEAAYQEALKLRPQSAKVHTELFDLYLLAGNHDQAEKNLKAAIIINPNSTRWKKYIAFHKDVLKKDLNSIQMLYREALENTDNDVNLVAAYAEFMEKEMNNAKAAYDHWILAGEVDPENKAEYDAQAARLAPLIQE